MGKIKLNSWSGYIRGTELEDWLKNISLVKKFIADNNYCGLIEYVHRFKLACGNELNNEIEIYTGDINSYCLRGRIFWDHGQIFFRKTEPEKFQFLIVSEDNNINIFNILNLQPSVEEFEIIDKNFILWGTYDPYISGYREERVSGFSRIDYPSVIGNNEYPILVIREYIDEIGNVIVWRFLGLKSVNNLPFDDKGVLDEKGQS